MKVFIIVILLISTVYGTFNYGDIFVSVGGGTVKRFNQNGNLLQTITSPTFNNFTMGIAFDQNSNLYLAKFDINVISKFDSNGNVVNQNFMQPDPQSGPGIIVTNSKGEFYVGQFTGTKKLLHFNPDGTRINSFTMLTDVGGTLHFDLGLDGCTVYYTSFSNKIRRFNICTNTQLTDLAAPSLPVPFIFGIKVRNNGEILAVSPDRILRYSSGGSLLQTIQFAPCSSIGLCTLFSLALDLDGSTMWVGDINSGIVYNLNIATGSLIKSFPTSPVTSLGIVEIYKFNTVKTISVAPSTQIGTVGQSINLNIQLTGFSGPVNTTFSITGANPQIKYQIINGQGVFSYHGSSAGNDLITITADGITNKVNVTWVLQVCNYGARRCINGTQYQICRINQGYANFWDNLETCCSGYVCNPNNNGQHCIKQQNPLLNTTTCTLGQMRCDTNTSYQSCYTDPKGNIVWGVRQVCGSGLVCIQSNNNIYCMNPQNVVQPSNCSGTDMLCTSTTTYRRCISQFGTFGWGPEQSCGAGTHCHQSNNVIYCY